MRILFFLWCDYMRNLDIREVEWYNGFKDNGMGKSI